MKKIKIFQLCRFFLVRNRPYKSVKVRKLLCYKPSMNRKKSNTFGCRQYLTNDKRIGSHHLKKSQFFREFI